MVTIPYKPASLLRYEFCPALVPGVRFDHTSLPEGDGPSNTQADDPFPSLYEPSHTAIALPSLIALAIVSPLSEDLKFLTLHCAAEGSLSILSANDEVVVAFVVVV